MRCFPANPSMCGFYRFAFLTGLLGCFSITTTATNITSSGGTNVFASEDPANQPQESNIVRDRQSTPLRKRRPNPFESRIIGGSEAKQGRYPYIVSILTEGGSDSMAPACGGTLIAKDIVLTAAHCRNARLRTVHIGRYNRTDPSESFEIFSIEEQISHPNYNDDTLDHDVMILKLSGVSSNPPVALNRDPTIPFPRDGGGDDLLVLGFGVTEVGGDMSLSASETLQLGIVQHVPNELCETAESPDVDQTYQGLIMEDMMCAWGNGVDACQGDSGSGLIDMGETVEEDIQVGVTSWGYRCAHPDFPGVYARVSFHWDFIASQVCQVSSEPPSAFKCNSILPDGIGTMEGTDLQQQSASARPSSSSLVPVTLKIHFDSFASEISWKLTDASGNTIAAVPYNSYVDGRTLAIRTFFLQEGNQYSFSIEDSYRDGLCCSSPGNYMLTMKDPGGGTSKLLVFGKGEFGATESHDFVVGLDNDDIMIDENAEIISSLQIDVGVPLRVAIQLDQNPTETGWLLERIGFRTEIVARVPAGAYRMPGAHIVEEISLEEEELYRFVLLDEGGNGIDEGRVRLILGSLASGGVALFDHNGAFASSLEHSFLASTKQTQSTIPSSPDNTRFLTLEIRMDLYPEEVGFQLRAETIVGVVAMEKRASGIIFFRPPRFYNASHTNQIVHETIPIPPSASTSIQQFSLIMIDTFGDGLCCRWQGHLGDTGYTLFEGDPVSSDVLVSSSFTETSREVYSFSITPDEGLDDGDNADVGTLAAPLSSLETVADVPIRVILNVDDHPYESGFKIVDSDGRAVVDVAPGIYRDANATVKEVYSLTPGVYTFTIMDSHGDGIDSPLGTPAYEVLLTSGNGLTIISGNGQFLTSRDHAFVIEGEGASIPVLIKIDHDDDQLDVGFQIERLDLAQADAIVATFSGSQHTNFDSSITGSLLLERGGLYRLSLVEDSSGNFTGTTRIAMGSFANYREVGDIHQQPKFIAQPGEDQTVPTLDTTDSEVFLSLSIPSQLNSNEIDWVLLALDLETRGQPFTTQSVIAYGPNGTSTHEDFRNDVETIPLPPFDGKQSFMLIVSHSSGDACCTGAAGTGLIQLFQGPPEDQLVLIGTSFDGESRMVEIFHLQSDDDEPAASGSWRDNIATIPPDGDTPLSESFFGTAILCGGLFLVGGFLGWKMCNTSEEKEEEE